MAVDLKLWIYFMYVVAKCSLFVMSYMTQKKKRKQTLESAQYGLEIIFKQQASSVGFYLKFDFVVPLSILYTYNSVTIKSFYGGKFPSKLDSTAITASEYAA